MRNPTATIYQNETNVIMIFSSIGKEESTRFRGASISFENHWMDGGACGISGFDTVKERNQYLKENNYVKKGVVKLGLYCCATHTVDNRKHPKDNGATLTCLLKPNHKGKHNFPKMRGYY